MGGASSRRDSIIYRDAAVDFRQLGNLELAETAGWLAYSAADPYDETHGHLCSERLRAAKEELGRRVRLHASGADVPNPRDARYQAWRDLAAQIRDRVDIVSLFEFAGHGLAKVGAEHAGPCIACGGTDRMRVWSGPPGRFWCRRCEWSGDAITAARNLYPVECPSFTGAVTFLAGQLGLPLPDGEGQSR